MAAMTRVGLFIAVLLAGASQADTLGAGDRRERDLAAGQAHTFAIELGSGQFVHAVVAPQGVDVAVALHGPDGQEIVAVDIAPDQVVAEHILAVVDRQGRYRLTIKPAVERTPAGRYVLRIEAVRLATAEDIVRVGARRTLEAAVKLAQSNDPNAWQRAVQPLEDALADFQRVGDRDSEAMTLLEAAWTSRDLGRPEARGFADRALALYRELGDAVGVARTTSAIGGIHARGGALREASDTLLEALALLQKSGNRTQEASTLNWLGIVYGRSGEPERAVEAFQKALQIEQEMRLARQEVMTLSNLGIATKDLGEPRLSLKYYEEALALARARGDRNLEAVAVTNLGNLYRLVGEHNKALAAHEAALVLARAVGNVEFEARAINGSGLTYYRLGDFQKALEYHDRSLSIRRATNDRVGQAASLDASGLALHRLGKSDDALARLTEALQLRRATAERSGEADTLKNLAQVEHDRGNLTVALEHVEAAVQLTDTMRGQLLSPELRASFIAAEQGRYELYIDVLMRLHDQRPRDGFDERAIEASERGRARVLLESLLEARTDIRQGVDAALLERERAHQRQLDAASRRLSRLLTGKTDPKELEAARAAMATLSAQYRELEVEIRKESPTYASLTQPSPLTVSEMQRDLVDAETILLEYSLGEARSWLWAVTPAGVASFELPPRPVIEATSRRVYELLTARQPRPNESAANRSARLIQADAKWRKESVALSRMVLGPAAAHFGETWRARRLLIVAADVLQFLPFAALADPAAEGQPLIVDHEVVSLPSASVLSLIRQQTHGRIEAPKHLAVIADPVFNADDPRIASAARREGTANEVRPATVTASGVSVAARALRSAGAIGESGLPHLSRLPFTRQEARAISTLVPAGQRLEATDFRASRMTVMRGDLSEYRLVHFATHGFFNSEQPELSGLVLSLVDRDGRAQDGFLRLTDIYNLRLPAEVVVLSACQTALGKEIRGEGVIGLTRGFMYAGARRVVASLWQVDDLATAELMRVFYRGMLTERLRPAAALRKAQRQLAQDPRWSSPFYWSAFVLQGEWR